MNRAKLIKRLMADRRVPVIRKFAFGGTVALLLALLLIPDAEVILAGTILPVIGNILGIPLDAGLVRGSHGLPAADAQDRDDLVEVRHRGTASLSRDGRPRRFTSRR